MVRAELSSAIRYPNDVTNSLCGNLDICLNYYTDAYFRLWNSARLLSVADRDWKGCFFKFHFSVGLLNSLWDFAIEILFARRPSTNIITITTTNIYLYLIGWQKAIDESEQEWAQNTKLVDLSKKNIRHAVPKGFPYFAVDFGMQGGFAHVIEEEASFPHYFGKVC